MSRLCLGFGVADRATPEERARHGDRELDNRERGRQPLLRKVQMDESAAAGTAYQAGLTELDWYQGGEYVVTNELGIPVRPEWYSDEFGRLLKRVACGGSPCTTPGTTLTLMEHAGVPISIVSKWAGHYDSAFTQKTYLHASDDDLHQGRAALAKIHKIA